MEIFTPPSDLEGPLHVKDVEFTQLPPPLINKEVSDFIKKRNDSLLKRRVGILNRNYKELKRLWPDAHPVELFMAFKMEDFDMEETKKKIVNPYYQNRYTHEVESIVGKGKLPIMISATHDSPSLEPNISSASPDGHFFPEKHGFDCWSEKNFQKFIELYHNNWKLVSDIDFAEKVGLSIEDTLFLINKLKSENKLDIKHKKRRKKVSSDDDDDSDDASIITGISFVFAGVSFRVGKPLEEDQENPENPLQGYWDFIAQCPLVHPAMSPGHTVLNYSTWVKITTTGDHTDPLTRQVVKKRQIIKLNKENIQYYIKHINLSVIQKPEFVE